MLEVARIARRFGPLAGKPREQVAAGGIAISVLEPMTRFSLRLRPTGDAPLGTVAGFPIDQRLNTIAVADERWSVRLGPDEWLIGAPADQAESAEVELERALGNVAHSLVDVSHRNVGLEIKGLGAAAALNAGCPLDLSDIAFPAGTATRTLLGKAEIVLIRAGAAPTYRIETWRSFATYVHGFLHEAVAGLGLVTR